MRKANVFVNDILAGVIAETDEGYLFSYAQEYLQEKNAPVSLTLPLQKESYFSKTLFPFFDGLIPEGWLLDVVVHNWKVNPADRFGIMLVACKDPVGNVYIKEACDDL